MNLFQFAHLLIRHRKPIAMILGSGLIVIVLLTLLLPNQYTSRASILPSGKQGRLADLKELAGLPSSSGTEESSSELYPVILQSHTIREAVLAQQYDFMHAGHSMRMMLPKYFGEGNAEELHKRLSQIFRVSVSKNTGVIELFVETKFPGLSRGILSEFLNQLERYNLHGRASQARRVAEYLERELDSAQIELASTEDRLSSFQNANRNWANTTDPELQKELARLQRDVTAESAAYLFVRRELEMARLDAQKDIPIIRILDAATLPLHHSSPRRLLIVLASEFILLVLVVSVVVANEVVRQGGVNDHHASYSLLRSDLQKTFPRSIRWIRRLTPRPSETTPLK